MRSVGQPLAVVMVLLVGCTGTEVKDPVDTELVVDETEVETDPGVDTEVEIDTDLVHLLNDPCLEGELSFELGVGEVAFTPIEAGASVEFQVGGANPPGYHVWGAVRVRNLPQFVSLDFALTDVPTGVVVGDYRFNVALIPSQSAESWACEGKYTGMMGVLQAWEEVRDAAGLPAGTPVEEVFCGTDLRMDVVLWSGGYEFARSSLTIKVQPDPQLAAPCETPIR
jgi:hypothetical protein